MTCFNDELYEMFGNSWFDLPKNREKYVCLKAKLASLGIGLEDNAERYLILATSPNPWDDLYAFDWSFRGLLRILTRGIK